MATGLLRCKLMTAPTPAAGLGGLRFVVGRLRAGAESVLLT
jgi:hypothetical protein